MAKTPMDAVSEGTVKGQEALTFQADGAEVIKLPSGAFIADADMTRAGDDLVLESPSGETIVIEGYFSADPAPTLTAADGSVLTPNLVQAFVHSPMEFAANETASDESPVGAVEEVKGNATVTRADGTVETITIGTPIYQGDVIETDASGAVNIVFMDETSMAVSENARLAIDEYTFDPATESGTTNFSVLRGLFVFTSGLIGRDDPDDVTIDTPVGSIGIRGTVIAGEINPGGESKITVLEGAIVVKNGLMDITLSEQFETVRLGGFDSAMENIGTVPANDIGTRFNSIGDVSPSLFTTINDAAGEQSKTQQNQPSNEQPQAQQNETAPEVKGPAHDADIITLKDTAGLPATGPAPSHMPVATESTSATSTKGSSGHGPETATFTPAIATPELNPKLSADPVVPVTTSPRIAMMGGTIVDTAVAGTTIGMLHMLNAESGTTFTYTFANGTTTSDNGYYTISGNNVVLTATGAGVLAGTLDVVQLGDFAVKAIAGGTNTIVEQAFSTMIKDAHETVDIVNLNNHSTGSVSILRSNLDNKAGYSITALGDVDNDGFDDFAFSNGASIAGQNFSYMIHGSSGALASTTGFPIASILNNKTLAVGDFSETVIAGIGDFDGDGVEDYVVGQQNNNVVATIGSGNAAIVSGANPLNFITMIGVSTAGSLIGASVDGIGDFNNDGRADVVIGAPGGNTAYFVRGGGWTDFSATATGATNMTRLYGSGGFGGEVEGIGDFNGDGFSDFAIGSVGANSNDGEVHIYQGYNSASPAVSHTLAGPAGLAQGFGEEIVNIGDFNGDGKTDIIIGGNGNIAKMYMGTSGTAVSSVTLDFGGSYTLTGGNGVGDFNGDGYDDFVITLGDNDSTNAYVVFGRGDAITDINLAYLKNPDNALELRYSLANENHDIEVSGIGDINGDGYDDFALGVPDANGAAAGNGGVVVVYGRDTGDVQGTAVTATADNQSLVGTTSWDIMSDGGFTGISLRGGAGNDMFYISNKNFLGIDGGGGTDKLVAQGSLNFSDIDFEKMSGIEYLEYGATNQTMTLSLENIFNLLKSSDTGDFKIDSSMAGSVLNISGAGWAETGANAGFVNDALNTFGTGAMHEGANSGYNHFKIGGYDLYIDTDVTVNVQA